MNVFDYSCMSHVRYNQNVCFFMMGIRLNFMYEFQVIMFSVASMTIIQTSNIIHRLQRMF